MEKESIFLTTREAIQAIVTDFRQYDPQLILFSGIIRLITENRIHMKLEPERKGAWINRSGKLQMQWLSGPETVNYMCDCISKTDWNPEMLAKVCARVFQTRATPETDTKGGQPGVRILTHMEDFNCRQCGFCCRFLEYQNEVTTEDVSLWKESGREDVLKWVETFERDDHSTGVRAWVTPVTRKPADKCPFLMNEPESDRWICRIHDVKPAFCRQFPLNRKHAVISGCQGFKKEK